MQPRNYVLCVCNAFLYVIGKYIRSLAVKHFLQKSQLI